MSEEPIKQLMRRLKEKTAIELDRESFNVGAAKGKLAEIADFTCFDIGVFKLVKVCYKTISKIELNNILNYNKNQPHANTIWQLFFWNKYQERAFYKPKLHYNQPQQHLSSELKNLVK